MAVKAKVPGRIQAARKAIPRTNLYGSSSCQEAQVKVDHSNKVIFKAKRLYLQP